MRKIFIILLVTFSLSMNSTEQLVFKKSTRSQFDYITETQYNEDKTTAELAEEIIILGCCLGLLTIIEHASNKTNNEETIEDSQPEESNKNVSFETKIEDSNP